MNASKIILCVDDDPAFLGLFSELMHQASGGEWTVIQSDNPAKALGSLKESNLDMLVVDERMPVMSGLQFVRLARTYVPSVPIVVLTGHAEEQTWPSLVREGVAALLQKPRSSEEFQTLFLTLHQLLALERQHGFRGVMHDVQLQDILQLECLRRNSSILVVSSKSESGEIFIRRGSIVHAAVGVLTGDAAFYHLVNLEDGEFRLKPYEDPPERTMSRNWETLLMEAAQLRDEVAGRALPPEPEQPVEAPMPDSPFSPVALTEDERVPRGPARSLLAVSVEGCLLASVGEHDASLPQQLAGVLRDADWFKTAAALGSLETLEAIAPAQETAMHFQPESVVFVTRAGSAHDRE